MSEPSPIAENLTTASPATESFDVFLSHNSKEKPVVERIAEKLKRAGLEPWLDKWRLTPGGDWQEELAAGLRASSACAVFIGQHGIGSWEDLEYKLATDRVAKDRAFRLFLVLLPGLPEPFDTSQLPPFLSLRTWVDLRRGVDDKRAFQTLIHAIKGLPLGPERAIEPNDDVCPYRGLRTFDERHAEFFFGRDGDIQRLVEKLKTTRFLAVLGASGSGKSSLVRAGLIPALRRGALPESADWTINLLTPGARPLESLAVALSQLNPANSIGRMIDEMRGDERGFHLFSTQALAGRPTTDRVVWVVDQFEEVFTLCHDEHERARFFANLLYAAFIPDGRCLLVLTMRADFYQKCSAHAELSARLSDHQFLVSPMTPDGLRQAIEEPAWRVGLEFEAGLVKTILNDIENQPGALPLLEHALLELWERRRGGMLTLEAYRESGGIEGAIAKRADAIYHSFSPEQQEIVRRVMLRLTQPGEGTEDTRRRAALSELVTRSGENQAIEVVVQSLTEARLLTTSGDDQSGEKIVDVSHEALIRGWPQLRKWIEDDRSGLRVLRRLTETAQEWMRAKRDPDLLFRGARLAQAVEWRARNEAALNELEREFLDASVAARDGELRARQMRTRLAVGGLVAALAVISVFAWYSYYESQIARSETLIAKARSLAASSLLMLEADPELSLLLAIEAGQMTPVRPMPRVEQALRYSLLASQPRATALREIELANHAAFSSDGKFVVIANNDGVARVWDVSAWRNIAELRGHTGAVNGAAFSPDGRLIVTAGADNTARIWEASGGRGLAELRGHAGALYGAAFSPDGQLILTASEDGTARVWDAGAGRSLAELRGRMNWIKSSAFSPDGKFVVTADEDGAALVWQAAAGRNLMELRGRSSAIKSAAFSPDSKFIVTAGADGVAHVWDAGAGRLLTELRGHASGVNSVAFSPDSKFIVTASSDKTAWIWEAHSGRVHVRLRGHTGEVSHAAFSPDGKFAATASRDGAARVWETSSGRGLIELQGPGRGATHAAFSPDGKLVVVTGLDGIARFYSCEVCGSLDELLVIARKRASRELTPEERQEYLQLSH